MQNKVNGAELHRIGLWGFFLLFLSTCTVFAGSEGLDTSKYIGIDEIKPGMKAYCLTVYKGTQIERFELEVLDVIRDWDPGRNAILVQGVDERFIHTGPVGGCSGSPVFIDGRLAGALAFGWRFSKDPLYGVTPIDEMLAVPLHEDSDAVLVDGGYDFDAPIDLEAAAKTLPRSLSKSASGSGQFESLPVPLVVSGLEGEAVHQLESILGAYSFDVVSAPTSGGTPVTNNNGSMERGSPLAVPLVTGDISMSVIGTVTEVADGRVYGFGHSFLGQGATELPMATAKIHTVVSSVARSFKLASPVEIIGSLKSDHNAAVVGVLGDMPRMIPMQVRIERDNAPKPMNYDCRIVGHRFLTPLMFRSVLIGAIVREGDLPFEYTTQYDMKIDIENHESIEIHNISSGDGGLFLTDFLGAMVMLVNNPYEPVRIEGIEVSIAMTHEEKRARMWELRLSDNMVNAGDTVEVQAVIETRRSGKSNHTLSFEIPKDTQPGMYQVLICGGQEMRRFLNQARMHRFQPDTLKEMIAAINEITAVANNKLYCLLLLRPDGVTLERSELPHLPASKAVVLQDSKRSTDVRPWLRWVKTELSIPEIVTGQAFTQIIVEP